MIQHSDPVERLASMQRLYLGDAGVNSGQESRTPAPRLTSVPILLEHARDDPVVSVENGTRMRDILRQQLGFRHVEWHEYDDGGHWVNEPQGVDDFVAFLRGVMGHGLC